jgi:hypothetical protein
VPDADYIGLTEADYGSICSKNPAGEIVYASTNSAITPAHLKAIAKKQPSVKFI